MGNHYRSEMEEIAGRVCGVINEVLESLELGQLNEAVKDTAGSVLEEAKKQMEQCRRGAGNAPGPVEKVGDMPGPSVPAIPPLKLRINRRGRVSGILFTVFGAIGSGVFGVLALTLLSVSAASLLGTGGWLSGGISGVLAIGFGFMLGKGIIQNKRLGRLKKYTEELKVHGKSYCDVERLGRACGRTKQFVKKDLKRMLALGMLPDVRMDDEGAWVILDEETYRQYRQSEEALKQKERERLELEKRRAEKEKHSPAGENREEDALDAAIRQGEQYMETLDRLRDSMKNEPIKDKLERLDRVLERLFETLRKHPEQLEEMEQFMEYYLPTTVKMVSAYGEFAAVEFPGDNINGAKTEICQAMDTINQAFEKLLDDMYEDAAFDIITDASVLKTMLAREGMMEADFKTNISQPERR